MMRYGFRIKQRPDGRVVAASGHEFPTASEAEAAGEILLIRSWPTIGMEERFKRWEIEVYPHVVRP